MTVTPRVCDIPTTFALPIKYHQSLTKILKLYDAQDFKTRGDNKGPKRVRVTIHIYLIPPTTLTNSLKLFEKIKVYCAQQIL